MVWIKIQPQKYNTVKSFEREFYHTYHFHVANFLLASNSLEISNYISIEFGFSVNFGVPQPNYIIYQTFNIKN